LNGFQAQVDPLGIYTDNEIPDLIVIQEEFEEEEFRDEDS
jgi:hypothetical protein